MGFDLNSPIGDSSANVNGSVPADSIVAAKVNERVDGEPSTDEQSHSDLLRQASDLAGGQPPVMDASNGGIDQPDGQLPKSDVNQFASKVKDLLEDPSTDLNDLASKLEAVKNDPSASEEIKKLASELLDILNDPNLSEDEKIEEILKLLRALLGLPEPGGEESGSGSGGGGSPKTGGGGNGSGDAKRTGGSGGGTGGGSTGSRPDGVGGSNGVAPGSEEVAPEGDLQAESLNGKLKFYSQDPKHAEELKETVDDMYANDPDFKKDVDEVVAREGSVSITAKDLAEGTAGLGEMGGNKIAIDLNHLKDREVIAHEFQHLLNLDHGPELDRKTADAIDNR